jgi:transcriptional regulator with XRE-family HTH domain
VPNNLKRIRENMDITLRELSTKVNIDSGSISRIENGKQSIIDYQAIALADFFKVSIDYLLGRTFVEAEKITYREKPLTYENILSGLSNLDNKQLSSVLGAVDYILMERMKSPQPNTQIIKNTIDKTIKKNT